MSRAAARLTQPSPAASSITGDLLAWYDRHRRALPWRALPGSRADPYAVWLSEIMLQQTTVRSVKPFFASFLGAWPTVQDLAAASLDDVMRAWAGLGYYSRARNLHACAEVVAHQYGGCFPETEDGLRALPGIGAYTAAAIAAIAFGARAVVVDGNVERVMARVHAIEAPLPAAKPAVYARMGAITPAGRPGDFAQAVMDLGATICTPKNPACAICPLMAHCVARQRGAQLEYPRRQPKRTRPVRFGTAYFITDDSGAILLRTRPDKGLLGRMAELPGSQWLEKDASATRDVGLRARQQHVGTVKHVFTHFTLMLDVVVAHPASWRNLADEFGEGLRWVAKKDLAREALPTLTWNAITLAQSVGQSSFGPA